MSSAGALSEGSGGFSAGAAYAFYGPLGSGTASLATARLKLTGEAANDLAGSAIASISHNGDESSDIVVGAYQNGAGGSQFGAVYLVNGLGY